MTIKNYASFRLSLDISPFKAHFLLLLSKRPFVVVFEPVFPVHTVCPFYIVSYYIKWVTTSWTYSNGYINVRNHKASKLRMYVLHIQQRQKKSLIFKKFRKKLPFSCNNKTLISF